MHARLTANLLRRNIIYRGHRQDCPPARITAPVECEMSGALKLLSDTRDDYFRQSAATRDGVVAPFAPRK